MFVNWLFVNQDDNLEIKFLRIFSLMFVVSFEDGLDAFKRAIGYKELCIHTGVMHGVKEIIFIALKFWGSNELNFEICIFSQIDGNVWM